MNCRNCGLDDHDDGECLLIGTGLPGADRRRYLREHPQDETPSQAEGG